MVKTTVYLDDDVVVSLRQLASSQKRTQAELIREALREYAERASPPKPKAVGIGRSGESDISERVEEILKKAARDGRWR